VVLQAQRLQAVRGPDGRVASTWQQQLEVDHVLRDVVTQQLTPLFSLEPHGNIMYPVALVVRPGADGFVMQCMPAADMDLQTFIKHK
jgi:hypothetical protein